MESGWRNSFNSRCSSADDGGDDSLSLGHDGNYANSAWDVWDIGTTTTVNLAPTAGTRYDWSNHVTSGIPAATATASARAPEESVVHALLFNNNHHQLYPGVGSMADPHKMCLKLGKRHYFEDAVVPDRHVVAEPSFSSTRRAKPPYQYYLGDGAKSGVRTASSPAAVPRCQVEGCQVALSNTKEYYRRHKVCEIHSKAPKVVVLGLPQRFCQQCSRFHGVTEFDEAKRSCRRRLEGHNQRRRKGSHTNSLHRNFREERPYSKPGCALSLLSSPKLEPGDLSSRCSAALSELIAANRATTVVGGHLWNQNASHLPQMWNTTSDQATMTLDLMQAPAFDFGLGLLSMKDKSSSSSSKDPQDWNDYCWSNVV